MKYTFGTNRVRGNFTHSNKTMGQGKKITCLGIIPQAEIQSSNIRNVILLTENNIKQTEMLVCSMETNFKQNWAGTISTSTNNTNCTTGCILN